jgi:hypothetical protein
VTEKEAEERPSPVKWGKRFIFQAFLGLVLHLNHMTCLYRGHGQYVSIIWGKFVVPYHPGSS